MSCHPHLCNSTFSYIDDNLCVQLLLYVNETHFLVAKCVDMFRFSALCDSFVDILLFHSVSIWVWHLCLWFSRFNETCSLLYICISDSVYETVYNNRFVFIYVSYTNIDQKLVNSLNGLLNCEIHLNEFLIGHYIKCDIMRHI